MKSAKKVQLAVQLVDVLPLPPPSHGDIPISITSSLQCDIKQHSDMVTIDDKGASTVEEYEAESLPPYVPVTPTYVPVTPPYLIQSPVPSSNPTDQIELTHPPDDIDHISGKYIKL